MKFKLLMDKLSYQQKTVKELKRIVAKLSQRLIKVDRNFLKSLGIYCTRSALNKRELIKVIDWFVAVAFIQVMEWNILTLTNIFLNDKDISLIFDVPSESNDLYATIIISYLFVLGEIRIIPSNDLCLFDGWDTRINDDAIKSSKGNLWDSVDIISIAPKYIDYPIKDKNFSRKKFNLYIVKIDGCNSLFEITTKENHKTFMIRDWNILKLRVTNLFKSQARKKE